MLVIKERNGQGQFVEINVIQDSPGLQDFKGNIDEQGSAEENVDIWINPNRDIMGILTKISNLIYDNSFIDSRIEISTIAITRSLTWL